MTIRDRMQQLTRDAKSQVDLDRLYKPIFQKLMSEFPDADLMEIRYEWENVKLGIGPMVDGDYI